MKSANRRGVVFNGTVPRKIRPDDEAKLRVAAIVYGAKQIRVQIHGTSTNSLEFLVGGQRRTDWDSEQITLDPPPGGVDSHTFVVDIRAASGQLTKARGEAILEASMTGRGDFLRDSLLTLHTSIVP